jgi:hypothetical protein
MTTATQTFSAFAPAEKAQKARLTLGAVFAALFMVSLRESLDEKASTEFGLGL